MVVGGSVLFVLIAGTERALRGSSEFPGFREIVQVSIVHDRDQYEAIPHIRAYPPFFAIAWAPFGLLPWGHLPDKNDVLGSSTPGQAVALGVQAAALLTLMAAMTFWSARCVAAACGREHGWLSCLPVLTWLMAGLLMLNSVVRCETDLLVVMLVSGAMVLLFARRQPWLGGVLLGAAASLKVTPGLFAVYLLCRRRWQAVCGMMVAGLVCSVLLPVAVWGVDGAYARYASWTEQVLLPVATQGPDAIIDRPHRATNQSLWAASVRYLTPRSAGSSRHPHYVNFARVPMRIVRRAVTLLKLGVLSALLAAWLAVPPRCSREPSVALFALVPVGMLLLSDVSIGGHLAILVVPLGFLCSFCFERDGTAVGRRMSWAVLAALALVLTLANDRLKEFSVPLLGVLALFALMLYVIARLQRQADSGPVQRLRRPLQRSPS